MQIVEVNNKSFEQMTHADALHVLRTNTHLAITVRSNVLGKALISLSSKIVGDLRRDFNGQT